MIRLTKEQILLLHTQLIEDMNETLVGGVVMPYNVVSIYYTLEQAL